MRYSTSIVWFRRDLRLDDHVALARALETSERVVCAFVLDPELLSGPRMGAAIVSFFFDSLAELRAGLRKRKSDLALLEGDFPRELSALAERLDAGALFYNVDYEPDALRRDAAVGAAFAERGRDVHAFVDHVVYEPREVLKPDETPYTVFTPYRRRWLARADEDPRPPLDAQGALARALVPADAIGPTREIPAPHEYGFERLPGFPKGGESAGKRALDAFFERHARSYAAHRNAPALDATSHLSPHLRAGTIGIRTCFDAVREALQSARGAAATSLETWRSELIWREFYVHILAHFPRVVTEPFVVEAKGLRYRTSESDWSAWCGGRTGYPIVDAAMIQLNTTGWMHNRLRMIVASFLTKDLLLDYRLGERYFEQRLADADLAANNGGWQWSSSTGTDAAPYFRVFNPVLQSKKFDPNGDFIRTMLPALAQLEARHIHEPWTLSPIEAEALGFRLGRDYPAPIVDHFEARTRALSFYARVLGKT